MGSFQLSITGMKCGGCVSTVEKILNNSDGIKNVSVNLLTESAYFEISQNKVEIEKVLENLEENGFPSKIYINDFSKKIIKVIVQKLVFSIDYSNSFFFLVLLYLFFLKNHLCKSLMGTHAL